MDRKDDSDVEDAGGRGGQKKKGNWVKSSGERAGSSSKDAKRNRDAVAKEVFVPGMKVGLEDGETELECDDSAYVMLHQAKTVSPCLSFDVVRDDLGDERTEFPHSMYLVAGTQAERSRVNYVIVMKTGNIHKLKHKSKNDDDDDDNDNDDESTESEEEDEVVETLPWLNTALLRHNGNINRIRVNVLGQRPVAASWSELGNVHIWDLMKPLLAVDNSDRVERFNETRNAIEPLFTFGGHQVEGYALDWSPTVPGQLLSGDCNKNIHLWRPQEGCVWTVDQRPYAAHTSSVEDLQWSPNEDSVFASCSVDRSIRIWDIRVPPNKACMMTNQDAHERDVNVISWNRNEPFIVSGGDDGVIKVWDLREFKNNKSVARFKHHTAPITSVEWHPSESTVFATSGSDEQLCIWDLSVERDADADSEESDATRGLPPQLLFIHQGQQDIKELHWHPQIPGVIISTASSGFNVFKTISV